MEQPVIIVTGASQGLGAAIAIIAAEKGAQVVLAARNTGALVAQAQRICQNGGRALVITADVSQPEDCQKVIDLTMQTFGRIDALINNAGVIEPFARISDGSIEDWAHHLAVNLLAPMMMCRLAIPHLKQSRGRVINLTSHGAELTIPGASAYSTSKAALNRFSKVLAAEEPDITVILFIPGERQGCKPHLEKQGIAPDEATSSSWLHEQEAAAQIPAQVAWLGCCLAWSGGILEWDDERVKGLEMKNE
jgi:NAD(P)-dependent dehydrogenase (short-subunit alcohol dehydrogenase family)